MLSCFLIVIFFLRSASSSGKFELQVLKVENMRNEMADGECCDSSGVRNGEGVCIKPCASIIRVCLKEYQSVTRVGGDDDLDVRCKLGNATSRVRQADDLHGDADHPVVHLILPFDFAWTVSACYCCVRYRSNQIKIANLIIEVK